MPTYSIVLSLMGAALLTMTACGGRGAGDRVEDMHSAQTEPAGVALREDLAEKHADPVMGTAAGWTVRLDLDGYFPDEDILVGTTSPDFWQQGSGAFITKPPYLNGKERQDYHRVYIRPTGEDWTEQMVTVVPDADGKLTITCYAVAPGAMNIVHWDDLRVEGATLANGGFEAVAEDGTPVGWDLRGWGDDAPRGELIHDPDDAAEGERYVTASWTWHWNATITDVVAERPIVLRWKSRFVPPETSYPVRVGISGLDPEPPHEHVTVSTPHWSGIDAETPDRYVGSLLDRIPQDELEQRYGEDRGATRGAVAVYLAEAGPDWVERTIELTPETDGELELTLHGARLRDREAGVYRPVLIDYADISVAGATLVHPGLTDEDDDGVPEGWQRIGADEDFAIMREEGGEAFARTWYQAGLRTTLTDITAEQPITITLRVRQP